jgi:hypothetical protein
VRFYYCISVSGCFWMIIMVYVCVCVCIHVCVCVCVHIVVRVCAFSSFHHDVVH